MDSTLSMSTYDERKFCILTIPPWAIHVQLLIFNFLSVSIVTKWHFFIQGNNLTVIIATLQ